MSAVFASVEQRVGAAIPNGIASTQAWHVDTERCRGRHASGLQVEFVLLPAPEEATRTLGDRVALSTCWVPEGYPMWAIMTTREGIDATLRHHGVTGDRQVAGVLVPLARAAGHAWVRAYRHAHPLAQVGAGASNESQGPLPG